MSTSPKTEEPEAQMTIGPKRTLIASVHDVDLELAEDAPSLQSTLPELNNDADRQSQTSTGSRLHLEGWRSPVIFISLFVGCFFSFLDTTIVAVSLPVIASKFHSFANSSWVFTAYLLAYMAFGVILARLSDFVGLKSIEVISLTIFLVFSAACGAARNMTELIVFRALQGVGGSGMYSMTMVISLAAVPESKIPTISACVSLAQAVAVVLGPVLGGLITQQTKSDNWRWIFYLNLVPISSALLGFMVAWPKRTRGQDGRPYRLSFKTIKAIDFLGAGFLLTGSVMLIFVLEEAGSRVYEWSSPGMVSAFWVSGVAFAAFVGWEILLDRKKKWTMKPVFPVKLAGKRVMACASIVTLLNGFVWYLIVLNLPDRFQLVNGDSPRTAGLRLLPMAVSAAIGTFLGGALSKRWNLTAYTTVLGSGLQVLGHGLMTTLSTNDYHSSMSKVYGFSVLLGLGFGISIASTTILTAYRFIGQPEHTAVMQGWLTQLRALGGSIGLAVSTIVFNDQVEGSKLLARIIPTSMLQELYKTPLIIEMFNMEQKSAVTHVFALAFRGQMWVALYVSVAALVFSLGCLERHPPPPGAKVQQAREGQERGESSSEDGQRQMV